MRSLKIVFLFIIVLLVSCNVETVDAPWNTKVVPCVFSVISPNHPIQVYIGKSYIQSDTSKINPYSKAMVYIRQANETWTQLKPIISDSSIFADTDTAIQVKMGQTYYLKVELPNVTLEAQTTVPNEKGIILLAESVFPFNNYKQSDLVGNLKTYYTLPQNKEYGCYLSSFPQNVDQNQFLTGNYYSNQYFLCPSDSINFTLTLVTTDNYLRKFKVAININEMQAYYDVGNISALLGSYGGVRPTFSNIKNGIGLFGSFVTDTKRVNGVILPE